MGALRFIVGAAVASVAFAAACGAGSSPGVALQTAVIDLSAPQQTINGFGSTERVWSDPHLSKLPNASVPVDAQRAILTALYRRLGLTRVRPVLDQGIQARPNGPFNFSGKLGDAHVAFVKQAIPYGLRTIFPAPVYFEEWVREDNLAAYVDFAVGVLQHWRSQGYTPKLFSPINEPQISHNLSPDWMRRMVAMLGTRMRAAGLDTRLVIPDDENPSDAYRRASVVMADPNARPYVAALAYHIYKWNDADITRMRDLAMRYRIPIWMTEYNDPSYGSWPGALDWAVKMHQLLTEGGVNAIDYLWGFFGSWTRPASMISIDFDNGAYRGFTYTPIYYLTGQFSRFVRPGYRRVDVQSSQGQVLTSSFIAKGRLVVVAVNTGHGSQKIRFSLRGARLKGRLTAVRTSSSESWKALPAVQPGRTSFSATLPPQSVTTFVGRR
jgi:O-glycosyl hydrolase